METYRQPHRSEPPLAPPDSAYYHLIHTITQRLPPPVDESLEALAARNEAALAQVAAMQPVNANEAALAAQCVAARAHADDVLLSVREHRGDIKIVMRLNAQYVAMVRASLSAHGHLLRVQAVRHKREKTEALADADAWTRHIATREMQQALEAGQARAIGAGTSSAPDLAAARAVLASEPGQATARVAGAAPGSAPATVSPAPAVAAAMSLAVAEAPAERAGSLRAAVPRGACSGAEYAEAGDPPRDLDEEVAYYAAVYPKRVREIRHYGGLPPNCSFGPPDDALVHALVTGSSSVLLGLDDVNAIGE